jgi:hypothetical protein
MKILTILILSFYTLVALSGSSDQVSVSTEPSNISCSKLKNSCEYYTCIEAKKQCGDFGYLKSFGHKYCQRFQDIISTKLSQNGRIWLQDVRSCLIDKLSKIDPQIGCYGLKNEAFKSHVPCYKKSGFCELKKWDKYHIIKTIKSELKNRQVLKSGLKILRSCRWIRFY